MLFLISSAPDTKEFKSAINMANEVNADICLLQNGVYASRDLYNPNMYVLTDELKLRGIKENEITCKSIDYGKLIDLMSNADKVVGLL